MAIKQLASAFAADADVRARFLAEAQLLATLDHPHVVPIYDYVEEENMCLLVMEKLAGGTVWQRHRAGRVGPETACALTLAAAAGLHHAHERQVLHRDIKPDNLMFSESGTLKVTDFGIAKVVSGATQTLTRAGEVVGTPAYMAPEQARGQALTPATDVYALGTVLYQLLSGRLPFSEDGTAMEVMYRHAYEDAVPIAAVADVPTPVADVVMCALLREPGDRYATAMDLGVALAEASVEAWGPEWLSRAETRESPAVEGLVQRAISTPPLPNVTAPSRALPTEPAPPAAPRPQRRRGTAVAIGALAAAAVAGVAFWVVGAGDAENGTRGGPSGSATTVTPTTRPPERVLADQLVAAWRANDRAAAEQLAPKAVVDALFKTPATQAPRFTTCETASSDEVDCSYGLAGQTLVVRLFHDAEGRYSVVQAVFVPD